jgi:hypothetical protein
MDRHNHTTRQFLTETARQNDLNTFITVTFISPPGWKGPKVRLTRRNASDGKAMMQAFAKALSDKLLGRSRRRPSSAQGRLSLIAIPEHLTVLKEETHLHYHCSVNCPEGMFKDLQLFTNSFWQKIGTRNYGSPFDVDISRAYTSDGNVGYSLKNLDSDFTIQHTVHSGLSA